MSVATAGDSGPIWSDGGQLEGYWSVVVSRNWRIVFRFWNGDVHDVDLVDYH
ncbi:MAG: hypothetical protein OXH66_12235 [Gemmatimonadetes bacterium]|nr:hypothetical protein [Gemmatimonadota bacterium]